MGKHWAAGWRLELARERWRRWHIAALFRMWRVAMSSKPGRPKKGPAGPRQDPERRRQIEQAAVTFVQDYFGKKPNGLGYEIKDRQRENVGYDLLMSKCDLTLCVEVKGRSGDEVLAEFTRNESRAVQEAQKGKFGDGDYRVCIVNDALEALGYPVLSVATRVGRRRGAARAVPAGDGCAHPECARCGDGGACGGATGGGVGQRGFRSGGRPSGDVSTRHIARRCGHRCRCSGVRRCTPERRRRGIPDRRPTWDVHAGTVSHGTPRRCAGVDGRADVRTGRCARGARPCSGPPNPGDGSDS